jgi:hypothetical protein
MVTGLAGGSLGILTTYQAYYLLDKIGTAKADVPGQIFLGTLARAAVVVAASLIGGRLSDRTGRRKIFVLTASVVYGLALFVIAMASDFSGFLVGMAISGLGFGVYAAVDLALVVDVLPDRHHAAKDLGVFNIAGALPLPSRRPLRRSSWPSAAAATACYIWSPESAPSSELPRSCRCGASDEAARTDIGRAPLGRTRPCCGRSDSDVPVGGRRAGRIYCGGDRRGPEALDDQPHAE